MNNKLGSNFKTLDVSKKPRSTVNSDSGWNLSSNLIFNSSLNSSSNGSSIWLQTLPFDKLDKL